MELNKIAPPEFSILHYGAIAELKRNKFLICLEMDLKIWGG